MLNLAAETLGKVVGDTIDGAKDRAKAVFGVAPDKPTAGIDGQLATKETNSGLTGLLTEVLASKADGAKANQPPSIVDKLTSKEVIGGVSVVAASLIAANNVEDTKGKDALKDIALGVGAITATETLADTFLPKSVATGAKMASYALAAYFLGGKIFNVGKQLLLHPIDSAKDLFTNPTKFLRDAGLIDPEDSKKTAEQMEAKRTTEDKAAVKKGENPVVTRETVDRTKRTQLIEKLTFHVEDGSPAEKRRVAEATVGTLSPTTIEMVLARYDALLATKKIKPGAKLDDVIGTIYDDILKTEEKAAYDKLGFWEKGLGKGARIVTSIGFSTIPIVGNVYSVLSALAGYDVIAGEELTTTGRIIMGVTGLIPFGGVLRGGVRLLGATAGRAVQLGQRAITIGGKTTDKVIGGIATRSPQAGVALESAQQALQKAIQSGNQMTIRNAQNAVAQARTLAANSKVERAKEMAATAGTAALKARKVTHITRGFFGYEGIEKQLENNQALNELGYLLGKTERRPETTEEVSTPVTVITPVAANENAMPTIERGRTGTEG